MEARSWWAGALALAIGVAAQTAGAQGVSKDAILIGQSAVLSGPDASIGREYQAGAKLYFDSVNQAGGVNGRQIVLESMDDAFKAENVVANTKKLIEEKQVFALFGYTGGNSTLAAIPAIDAAKIPLVGVFTGNQTLRTPVNRQVFNTRAGYYAEIDYAITTLLSMGMKRVAVVHFDDKGGKDSGDRVAAEAKKRGGEVVVQAGIERGSVKVEAAVKEINAKKPNAVVLVLTHKAGAALIRQLRVPGSAYQFINLSFTNADELVKELGPLAGGVGFVQVVPYPHSGLTSIASEFRKLAAAAKRTPSYISMEGFVAAKVLVEGLRRAGPTPTRAKFVAGLEDGRPIEMGEFTLVYSPTDHTGGAWAEMTMASKEGRMLR